MVRFFNYDIVFAEIPDEVTMAINLTGCPNRCPGCHSAHLQKEIGEVLDFGSLDIILRPYASAVTCVCFMGGDASPEDVNALAAYVKSAYPSLKTGWYSGKEEIAPGISKSNFDYIKLGPWIEERGPLSSPSTNQRLYKVDGWEDITYRMARR